MQIVMVEFHVGKDRVDACVEALKGITGTLVAEQPEFHGATLHVEKDAGVVINRMIWDSHEAFIDFRDSNAEKIGEVLGEFSPQGRMLEVVAEIGPTHGD
ncbi:MAG: antibiotic biosynthesis monooxygenase [Alphaproteobacteria bacterium]|nr:antibiotic biosynthesis monooxygenase [Alphaproteobacteria bacterium]